MFVAPQIPLFLSYDFIQPVIFKISVVINIPNVEVFLNRLWDYLELCYWYQYAVKPVGIWRELGLHCREMQGYLQSIDHSPEVL
jgi:hypothetical protein